MTTIKIFNTEFELNKQYPLDKNAAPPPTDVTPSIRAALVDTWNAQVLAYNVRKLKNIDFEMVLDSVGTKLERDVVDAVNPLNDDDLTISGNLIDRIYGFIQRVYKINVSFDYYSLWLASYDVLQPYYENEGDLTGVTFAIVDRIDWKAGDFGDAGSCWFSYHYRGRSIFEYEMKRGRAFAIKLWKNDRSTARGWFFEFKGQWVLFNITPGQLSANAIGKALAAVFGCKGKSISPSVKLSSWMSNNSYPWIFYTDDQKPLSEVHDYGWSDYDFNDLEIETACAKAQGGTTYTCDCCGMPRPNNKWPATDVRPHGKVCDRCLAKMETASFNSKLYDKAQYIIQPPRQEGGRRRLVRIEAEANEEAEAE